MGANPVLPGAGVLSMTGLTLSQWNPSELREQATSIFQKALALKPCFRYCFWNTQVVRGAHDGWAPAHPTAPSGCPAHDPREGLQGRRASPGPRWVESRHRRGRRAGGAELCPQRVKQDQRPREPQPRAAGGTGPQADHAWDELLPGRGVQLNKMPNVDSCPFREQPDLLRKKLWCFQIHTVPWLGKTSVEKSSFQGAQGTL
ncbi:uncharacterized protein LOC112855623 [Puma concolor]|uniref:Uncharacterized protein LOC112855623 n=1 Tax=Puma concolor TaxID=9696 RepID=A0A6P6HGV4_PUMCO|nr:uncharacterized protein LOC112855623 [Puma concolor]